MANYYDSELQRVLPKEGEIVSIRIVNGDTQKSTKWISLNLDSIDSLQAFIDIVRGELQ